MKVFWFDLETTGTSPLVHGIVQLAALFEIDGIIEEELDLKMRPLQKYEIDVEALEVSGKNFDEVQSYPPQDTQFQVLERSLERYVNRYDREDKFILAGYNINSFDEPFLRQLFLDNAATRKDRRAGGYFGSWFFWPKRDVQTYLAEHLAEHNLRLPNYKLATVCELFNIPIDAHDALSDIRATRTLYQVLRYSLSTAAQAA